MVQYNLTKRIAKHGRQAILVIPKSLENELKPGTLVGVTFEVLGETDK